LDYYDDYGNKVV
jgi:hypothetical protein